MYVMTKDDMGLQMLISFIVCLPTDEIAHKSPLKYET